LAYANFLFLILGTRRPRNEKHLRQTVQPANKTNPVIQTLAEPDVLTQFQFLVTGCETRISELKSAVDRLKKNQVCAKGVFIFKFYS
jgi:hypothetical protein